MQCSAVQGKPSKARHGKVGVNQGRNVRQESKWNSSKTRQGDHDNEDVDRKGRMIKEIFFWMMMTLQSIPVLSYWVSSSSLPNQNIILLIVLLMYVRAVLCLQLLLSCSLLVGCCSSAVTSILSPSLLIHFSICPLFLLCSLILLILLFPSLSHSFSSSLFFPFPSPPFFPFTSNPSSFIPLLFPSLFSSPSLPSSSYSNSFPLIFPYAPLLSSPSCLSLKLSVLCG